MLLEYDDVGTGPILVLLHGFPLDRSMWKSLLESEFTDQIRVIAPDLRGHGSSEIAEGPYSIDDMADDVIETLDSLHLRAPIVVGGLSMGGYVALSVALRYPNRVRGLMLINSRAVGDSPTAAQGRERSIEEILRTRSVEGLVESMLPKLFASANIAGQPDLVGSVKALMLTANPAGVINSLRALATRPDRSAQLDRVQVPTLVLAGENDQIVPLDEAKKLAGSLNTASQVVVPGAGHLTPLESPVETRQAITAFLSKLDRPSHDPDMQPTAR